MKNKNTKTRINWRRVALLMFIAFVYGTGVYLVCQTVIGLRDLLTWLIGAFTAVTALLIDTAK